MTYPKVSTDPHATPSAAGVPAEPALPRRSRSGAGLLGGRRHLPGQRRAARRRRRTATTSSSSTTGRRSPTACRTTATCSPATSRTSIPRYQTMRGRRVERRFGWDTHGLPAELEAMRQLGIKTKDEILELGIEEFNDAVPRVGAAVHRRVARLRHPPGALGRLRQRLQDPRTPTTWSRCIWAFKQLYDKGLVYEGFRVLPYCWNDETPLSNHELRMDDDVYQMRQDPAVTVGLRAATTGELALVWTTTPWTLPSNLADHGRPGHRLRRRRVRRHRHAPSATSSAEARLAAYARELRRRDAESSRRSSSGSRARDLRRPHATRRRSATTRATRTRHRVVAADFVTTEDGTGLVHTRRRLR